MKRLIAILLAVAAAPAAANGIGVSLDRAVFVEKVQGEADAKQVVREMPRSIARGDTLLFVVSWRNRGAEPASDVIVVNPVPPIVSYAGSDQGDELVSVDGGHTWGHLGELTVPAPGGPRPARPEDVTHVRWSFGRALGAGEAGELRFRGVVK